MVHDCEYEIELRQIGRNVTATTYEECKVCFECGKIIPRPPTHEYVSIKTKYGDDLILEY